MALRPDELKKIIADGEGLLVEFKESAAAKKIPEAVCAFANDINGSAKPGLILIGVKDDGTVVGAASDDESLQKLAQIRTDGSITPTPSMTIEPLEVDGKTVVAISVSPSDSPPVRYKGAAFIRAGTTVSRATVEEERRLTEQRRSRSLPFDARGIAGCGIDELDLNRFRLDYLPQAVNQAVLEENGRTTDEQLSALKLTDYGGCVTPTGLLVAGKDPLRFLPGAFVQFRRVAGSEITDETDDEMRASGTLDVVVRLIEDKLRAHNTVSLTIGGSRHERRALYPEAALQQVFRNAIMHRDYEVSAPVRVTWFEDRIQIDNPGGPFQISLNSFGKAGFTGYRNPNIAEAMRNLGLVERFGVGLPLAKKALRENGNPDLELRADENFVFAVLRKRP